MVSGAEGHQVHRWMLRVTGGSGAARDRVVGESSISGPRWDNEPATGIFRSPTGLATADPRCAWALATRSFVGVRLLARLAGRVGPRGELVGLRRVAHGQQRPDGDSKNEDGDDDDHEDFHRILLLDGCSPLGRVCCASASTVPLEFGVLGHMERDGYLPRAGANTPADAGLTRRARLWPRAVRPSRFVRSQPVYPCNGTAALQAVVSHGRDPDPAPPCSTTQR